jgi:imidazolonepropionase-like amidohydrolase
MRISYRFVAICVLANCLSFTKPLPGQTPAIIKTTAVRTGRMLDVKTGSVVTNAVILIENGRITAAASGIAVPGGAEVIDLGDALVLPG